VIERKPLPQDRPVLGRYLHPEGAPDARLDQLVSQIFPAFPTRASARKACERGEVAVDGWLSESCRWVRPGYEVLWVAGAETRQMRVLERPIPVLFEDDQLAVVHKPAGMPTSGHWARTLERTLPVNLRRCTLPDALPTPRPVHRLDAPTSGLVLVAKTRSAHAALGQAFEGRRVRKRYRAIAIGKLEGEGTIEEQIEGRPAKSRYVAVEHSQALRTEFITTLDLFPETGRTHQLRLHLAQIGHPILGDTAHGLPGCTLYGKGLFLCATGLGFEHPQDGRLIEMELDEPEKFGSFRRREERRYQRWHAGEPSP
jgi:23S rRNA pseudouridine1911/1915/1917 synthase